LPGPAQRHRGGHRGPHQLLGRPAPSADRRAPRAGRAQGRHPALLPAGEPADRGQRRGDRHRHGDRFEPVADAPLPDGSPAGGLHPDRRGGGAGAGPVRRVRAGPTRVQRAAGDGHARGVTLFPPPLAGEGAREGGRRHGRSAALRAGRTLSPNPSPGGRGEQVLAIGRLGMFGYYLDLALRSLKRNRVLTVLMVLAIAVGIGACMTTLTVVHLLSGDPIPGKSSVLYFPQVDPDTSGSQDHTQPYPAMDYRSAMDLWSAHRADRQAIITSSTVKLRLPDSGQPPMMLGLLSTSADFFPMFDVPFQYGSGWSADDDSHHARVVVISADLNQKLF